MSAVSTPQSLTCEPLTAAAKLLQGGIGAPINVLDVTFSRTRSKRYPRLPQHHDNADAETTLRRPTDQQLSVVKTADRTMAVAIWSAVWVVASTIVTVILLSRPSQYSLERRSKKNEKSFDSGQCSVQVVVLGDIGRSPRMQYHAISIARHGGHVQLIGYLDSEILPELKLHSKVTIVPLPKSPSVLQTSNKLLFLIFAPVKVLLQIWGLWRALGYQSKASRWMLVQNPPSIPTLAVAATICFLRRTKLVIDWHNFGYSILALKLGNGHPLVTVSRIYESILARTAHSHFAVTDVMRQMLKSDFIGSASVFTLHDRPAPLFQPLTSSNRLEFLVRSALTARDSKGIVDGKTRLVVSSTSWTADEDFSVLLEALCVYSASAVSDAPRLPTLLVIITGKGPQRGHYVRKIEELEKSGKLERVTVKTEWLSFEDYALLLGAADLGVSLHTSSSGVDLPMKVVDMFGAGLPVLGFDNFKAWPELVTENVNGKGFSNSKQMADVLKELLDPDNKQLEILKQGAVKESKRRWDSEWDPIAGKLFELV